MSRTYFIRKKDGSAFLFHMLAVPMQYSHLVPLTESDLTLTVYYTLFYINIDLFKSLCI